jgi:hypothetical protein
MNLPTPSEDNNDLFTQMAQLFIDTYEELASAMYAAKSEVEYSVTARHKTLVDLQERYTAIIKEYQEQIFAQPVPLDDKQKHYIELYLKGQCSDGYLMINLRIHDWNDAQSMIEQYKQGVQE